MPRLLLVDDNPSIHRIAESLLAPTDVELVCAGSAAEALDRLGRGELFDVALVDTAMPGMDGWALVARLRASEDTARMPIALMAGVLDPVDPSRLAAAPVQGFLKKPIELRELGDRVKTLLATPVAPPAPSAYSTVPAMPARELLQRAEVPLPEFRPEPPVPDPETEDDLLILTAEDVWEEEGAAPALAGIDELPEVQLELEELDLESLQLAGAEPAAAILAPPAEPDLESVPPVEEVLGPLPDLEDLDLGTMPGDLPTQERLPAPEEVTTAEGPAVTELVDEVLAGLDEPQGGEAVPAGPASNEAEPVASGAPEEAEPAPPMPTAAMGQLVAADGQPVQGEGHAAAVVQAILADPILVDALVKAVVARMGDQVLREIAWEVMPDLAEKLRP